jgi:hypothetical protein
MRYKKIKKIFLKLKNIIISDALVFQLPAIHNLMISHKATVQIKSKNQRTLIIKYISKNYKKN